MAFMQSGRVALCFSNGILYGFFELQSGDERAFSTKFTRRRFVQ